MRATLVSVVLALAILVGSAVITHLFARAMYLTCPRCRTLNARRRVHCRSCGWELRRAESPEGSK